MAKRALLTVALVLGLAGAAAAKPELNTPVLQVELTDDVVCFVSNTGSKNVTIEMKLYDNGVLVVPGGEHVLAPNERFTIGVAPGSFWWQCKIVIIKGSINDVRAILYAMPSGAARPAIAVDAR